MRSVETLIVEGGEAGMRLDRWFKARFPGLGHGRLERLLRTGQIRVDGGRARANLRLDAGAAIRVPPLDQRAAVKPEIRSARQGDRDFLHQLIVYEDDALIAFNKPFGLAVQGGEKTSRHIDGMLGALEAKGGRPRLVHRLDRDTGGVLVVARTRADAAALASAFERQSVEKTYWALVVGAPRPREGVIDLALAKRSLGVESRDRERMVPIAEGAKRAVTDYRVVDEAGRRAAFLALRPRTGRTHQLRAHCAAIGAPIVGDFKYGAAAARLDGVAEKLHLFCKTMTIPHPRTGAALVLSAPLGGHMKESWEFFGFDAGARVEWPLR